MPLKSVYFVPHGGAMVPELEGPLKPDGVLLNKAMQDVGREIQEDNIHIILMTSPHGYLHPTDYLIYYHNIYEEWLIFEKDGQQNLKRNMWMGNTQVAQVLFQLLREKGIPASPFLLGDTNYPLKISWGEAIPLSFLAGVEGPQVVIFSLPMHNGKTDREELINLGKTISHMLSLDLFHEVNVSLVISGDLSHKHDKDHHYGYHEDCKLFDNTSMQWIREGSGELMDKLYSMEETAAPCGLHGMNILQGVFEEEEWEHKHSQYGCPTYFGMAVASWKRNGK